MQRTTRGRSVLATLALGLMAGVAVEPRAERRAEAEAAPLRLVVNVAARRLHVYEDGERTRSYRVAVGKPGHRTPRGSYRISKVVWNPWWHPPKSKWARGKKPTPPGPGNPMGRVKLYFRNLYYIHGTPDEGSLGRAASHGCVRMANSDAIELARLVHEHGSPGLDGSVLDRLARNSKSTRTIWLKRPVPIQIVSRMAEVHDGHLEIYAGAEADDVLRDARRALREAGYDLATLDTERLREAVERGRRESISVPLAALVAVEPAGTGTVRGL